MTKNNNNPDKKPGQSQITGELLLKIVLVIFIVEILIMAFLPLIPLPDSRFVDALADASLLSVLTVILLVLWVKTDKLFLSSIKFKHGIVFFLYVIPAVVLLSLITYLSYTIQADEKLERAFVQHENSMHEAAHELTTYFNNRVDELVFLKNHVNSYFTREKTPHDAHAFDHIPDLFRDYILQHENLVQIRLIDNQGLEVVRFDKLGDGTTRSSDKLQNKFNRDYVMEGLRLKSDEVYFSHINLNREFGKIEKPIKPVMRGVVPVILENNSRYLVVLNWKLGRLFDHLRHYSSGYIKLQVADENGQWVLANNPEHEWGSDIVERSQFGLSFVQRDLWQQIKTNSADILNATDSVMKAGIVKIPNLVKVNLNTRAFTESYRYYIISELSDENAAKLTHSLRQSHIYLFLLALPFVVLATWLFVLMKQAQMKANQEVNEYAGRLEKQVSERTEELQIALEDALQANAIKSEFLANMSHELRTPMHSILSFTQIAFKKTQDEKLRGYLDKILISGERLTRLLNNLLDLAKLEASKMDLEFLPVNMKEVIDAVMAEMKPLFMEKDIEVNFDTQSDCVAEFDKDRLTQVVYNLLSNAVKFGPEKSVVDINLIFKKILTEDYLELTVTDEGPGIPAEEINQVFDKFVQSSKTKSQAGGTGLGLAICQQIVNAHNGNIWVESPPPNKAHGCRFIVQIPCEQGG